MVRRIPWEVVVFFVFFLSIAFYPLVWVHFVLRVPTDVEIDPEFINGLIAVSGISLGFVTAIAATRKDTSGFVYILLLLNWGLLRYAGTSLFDCALGQRSARDAVAWAMCSFTSSHVTAGSFLVLLIFGRKQPS